MRPRLSFVAYCTLVVVSLAGRRLAAEAPPAVALKESPGQVEIAVGGEPFAIYVYADKKISRPHFAHVKAPGGKQVTRNHPPVAGQDSPDHDTFHPGIWLSFGDINGSDFWRLATPVKFSKFTKPPAGGPGHGGFTARYDYIDQADPSRVVCHEDFSCDIHAVPAGVLMVWDSTFTSDKPFTFGDQEEMGLGFRIATALRAERESEIGLPPGNGEIVNSHGARNEDEIWGNTADWCDYSGVIDGQRLGIATFPHPKNFRPSWFHSRDYGMLAANPFGRAAFGKGDKSAVTVQPGEKFRLRYGVLIHAASEDAPRDIAGEYQRYVKLAGE